MTRSAFERLVQDGVERIPEKFRGHLEGIALVVEGEPTAEQRRSCGMPRGEELLGFYEGTPGTERMFLPYRLPDKITLFQGPLERACAGEACCIQEQVAHTVWHELAHAFGTKEDRLEELEAQRGWNA